MYVKLNLIIYQFYADPHTVFTDDYADIVETYFDGTHDSEDVFKNLNISITNLLNDSFLKNQVMNPKSLFIRALKKNDVYNWKPKAPIHLYHASSDTEVPFANSQAAYNYMLKHKA